MAPAHKSCRKDKESCKGRVVHAVQHYERAEFEHAIVQRSCRGVMTKEHYLSSRSLYTKTRRLQKKLEEGADNSANMVSFNLILSLAALIVVSTGASVPRLHGCGNAHLDISARYKPVSFSQCSRIKCRSGTRCINGRCIPFVTSKPIKPYIMVGLNGRCWGTHRRCRSGLRCIRGRCKPWKVHTRPIPTIRGVGARCGRYRPCRAGLICAGSRWGRRCRDRFSLDGFAGMGGLGSFCSKWRKCRAGLLCLTSERWGRGKCVSESNRYGSFKNGKWSYGALSRK